MSISELLKSIKEKALRHKEGATAAWDAFKGSTGMIPKEEQTIGNLKYAIRMNQEEMEPNEINFVDFNGMVLSMTIEEVMQLTEMPKPNEYYNLTFEHWTKTLEEIQDGRCHTVGATYHTTDGCNYYVVKVGDNKQVKLDSSNHSISGTTDWGDGVIDNRVWHTYEKSGRYIIKVQGVDEAYFNMEDTLIECYLNENVDRNVSMGNYSLLNKVSFPDNGTPIDLKNTGIDGCNNLHSLILGNSYIGGSISSYSRTPTAKKMQYLVVDGITSFSPANFPSLKCFSAKNALSISVNRTYFHTFLKHVVFDKVETIGANVFYSDGSASTIARLNSLDVVDLPESVQSIGNYAFRMCVAKVYLRTLIPPTLEGTNSIFRNTHYSTKTEVHIRKDATYTDAEGNTYTGLEAYANATNWSLLYAKTAEYTFIADL